MSDFAAAVKHKDTQLLTELTEQGCKYDKIQVWLAAIWQGGTTMLQWLHDHGYKFDEDMFVVAATRGDPEQLEWLHKHKYPLTARVFAAAAGEDREDAVHWLWAHGCPSDYRACYYAYVHRN